MLHLIWLVMVVSSMGYACLLGNGGEMLSAALAGSGKAVALTLELSAGYLFFCGMMEIARALHAEKFIRRLLQPVLSRLMPCIRREETRSAVALNLSMNVLGLGNAATPMGMEAMKHMEAERTLRPEVKHDMYMLLILNATSIQLLPTTVLTLRVASGSSNPEAVLVPTLLCTAFSTVAGVGLGMMCRKWEEKRHA